MKPYKNLYIYEIEGKVLYPKKIFQEDFLGCWCEGDFSYLFFAKNRKEEVKEFLHHHPSLSYRSETVIDYKDWETGKELKPFKVGRFYVSPVWEEIEEADHEIPIKVDPRLAFGSGNHATTKKCLEALCLIYKEARPRRVLDIGCGTGILSIASAKLGAETILAVDYSSLAVETTRKNCLINEVEDKVKIVEGEALDYLSWKADLLIANIYHSVIKELVESTHFKGKKWYLISGLLGTESHKITKRLQDLSINIIQVLNENLWFTILGKGESH